MSWGRLDDAFWQNTKVVSLSLGAFKLYVTAISFCASHGRWDDGHISEAELRMLCHLHGPDPTAIQELVACVALEVMEEEDGGGYAIHDLPKYRPPAAPLSPAERGSIGGRHSVSRRLDRDGSAIPTNARNHPDRVIPSAHRSNTEATPKQHRSAPEATEAPVTRNPEPVPVTRSYVNPPNAPPGAESEGETVDNPVEPVDNENQAVALVPPEPARDVLAREGPGGGLSAEDGRRFVATWNANRGRLPQMVRPPGPKRLRGLIRQALEAADGDLELLGEAVARAAEDGYYAAQNYGFETFCRHADRWVGRAATQREQEVEWQLQPEVDALEYVRSLARPRVLQG